MTTITSFSKSKSFVKNILRRNLGFFSVYFIVLFLSFPLIFISRATELRNYYLTNTYHYNNYYNAMSVLYESGSIIFLDIIAIMVPVVLGVMLFSYMHSRRSCDLFHSAGLKRSELYFSNWVAGEIIMIVPVLVCFGVIILAGALCLPTPQYFNALLYLKELLFTLVSMTVSFTFVSFITTLAYSSLDGFLFSMAVGTLPVLNYVSIIGFLFGRFMFGFRTESYINEYLFYFSPFSLLPVAQIRQVYWPLFIWLAISAGVLFAGIKLYGKRKSEVGGMVDNVTLLRHAVKYLCVTIATLLLSVLYAEIFYSNETIISYLIGAAIGVVISVLISEAILARGFYTIKKQWKNAAICFVIAALLILSVYYDWYGFTYRMPQSPDSVSAASMSFPNNSSLIRFTEKESIQKIMSIHSEILARHKNNTTYQYASNTEHEKPLTEFTLEDFEAYALKSNSSYHYYGDIVYETGLTKLARGYSSTLSIERQLDIISLESAREYKEQSAKTELGLLRAGTPNLEVFDKSGLLRGSFKPSAALSAALVEDFMQLDYIDLLEDRTDFLGYVQIIDTTQSGTIAYGTRITITGNSANTLAELERLGITLREMDEASFGFVLVERFTPNLSITDLRPRGGYYRTWSYPEYVKYDSYSTSEPQQSVYEEAGKIAELYAAGRTMAYPEKGYILQFGSSLSQAEGQLFIPYSQAPEYLKEDYPFDLEFWRSRYRHDYDYALQADKTEVVVIA